MDENVAIILSFASKIIGVYFSNLDSSWDFLPGEYAYKSFWDLIYQYRRDGNYELS